MKGVSVQGGIEIRIEVDGESWRQGGTIIARVTAMEAAGAATPLMLALADGNERKIKSRAEGAYQEIERITGISAFQHSFHLPSDARITDKSGSLYLRYGRQDSPEPACLRLPILPHEPLADLAGLLAAEFRFSLKAVAMGKNGFIEMKFLPPASKDWASLESLTLAARIDQKRLDLRFFFDRKELDKSQSALTLKASRREIERELSFQECIHEFNQRLNREVAVAVLDGVFTEYRSQSWLPV